MAPTPTSNSISPTAIQRLASSSRSRSQRSLGTTLLERDDPPSGPFPLLSGPYAGDYVGLVLAQQPSVALDPVIDSQAAHRPPEDGLTPLDDVDAELVLERLDNLSTGPVRRTEMDGVDLRMLILQVSRHLKREARIDPPDVHEVLARVFRRHDL